MRHGQSFVFFQAADRTEQRQTGSRSNAGGVDTAAARVFQKQPKHVFSRALALSETAYTDASRKGTLRTVSRPEVYAVARFAGLPPQYTTKPLKRRQ